MRAATLLHLDGMFLSKVSDKTEHIWTTSSVAVLTGHLHSVEARIKALKVGTEGEFQGV